MNSEHIIRFLKEKADFISGVEIAENIGVTRAAVWKRIKLLRKKGYIIEASPAKGYRLIKSPDLSIEEIKSSLSSSSKIIGREIIFFDTLNSTNTSAMEFAEKGLPEGTVIIADSQTSGRGRLGRKWLSPPRKNLYMSIILRPTLSPRDAAIVTLMSAVACASSLKRLSAIPISIKWPNDIIVSNKKLGGILTEIKADMDRILYTVIGIGININHTVEEMPDDIKGVATSIKIETGNAVSRTQAALEILKELDKWYILLLTLGKKPIIKEWRRLSSTIGCRVKVTVGDKIFTGVAEDIDEEGMLLLKQPDNSMKKISAGDVIILR